MTQLPYDKKLVSSLDVLTVQASRGVVVSLASQPASWPIPSHSIQLLPQLLAVRCSYVPLYICYAGLSLQCLIFLLVATCTS